MKPIDVMSPEFRADPAPFYARLRSEPIQQVEPGGLWALSRHEDVQFAFKNPKLFRYRLKRVAEITGWDATDPREGFVLQISIAAGRLAESGGPSAR